MRHDILSPDNGGTAQSSVTINPMDGSFQDSTTFVNLNYITSSSSNEYPITLKFAGISGSYNEVQVNWGDENVSPRKTVEAATSTPVSYTYKKEGCFPVQMYFFPGSAGKDADTLYAWALNTDLSLSYELKPVGNDKSHGCLSYGADTLLLRAQQACTQLFSKSISAGETTGSVPPTSPSE